MSDASEPLDVIAARTLGHYEANSVSFWVAPHGKQEKPWENKVVRPRTVPEAV